MTGTEVEHEQQYVSMLYGRLDRQRTQRQQRLAQVLRESGDTPQALSEREAVVSRQREQLAQLDAAEHGLCFGRLDLDNRECRYIGRLGIFDEAADHRPLLIDWRAPAARPFYLATAAAPDGVRRRRHIRTSDRRVFGVDDELLDLADAAGHGAGEGLVNEAALLAALNANRTGQMADIVTTIQAEQDRIIRASHHGVLVVEGGPGTGKTAVALHRAAYLLYTHRQELTTRGVLIVGPNPTFLRYIDQVLPSLGETAVLLRTVGDLYPQVRGTRAEPAEAAEIKGRLAMAQVVAAAVADRQRVPERPLKIVTTDAHPGLAYQPEVLWLDPHSCALARQRARASQLPHNLARSVFAEAVVDTLARQVADRLGADPLGGESLLGEADVAEIRRELGGDRHVQAAIGELWPTLTAQQLLTDLYASDERLATAAAAHLSAAQRRLLRREPGGGWTVADVPLLDEAAELLGQDRPAAQARARRERRERIAYAQGALEIAVGSQSIDVEDEVDPEVLAAHDLLDAAALAERYEERDRRSVAERAAADRAWVFGHIIVDEAQELSQMAWRVLMRRCPSRSMTVVGDPAQTGDLGGSSSWHRTLQPYVAQRWRLERLSVNYRTPAEIMAVAAAVLADLDPTAKPPRSVRETGVRPWRQHVPPDRLASLVADEVAETDHGRLAVVVPAHRVDHWRRAVPGAACGPGADLGSPVVILSVAQAKGLEFDSVLVVDPAQIVAESPRGRSDLYVALTRATQRLGVVHTGELPAVLADLRPRAGRAVSQG